MRCIAANFRIVLGQNECSSSKFTITNIEGKAEMN